MTSAFRQTLSRWLLHVPGALRWWKAAHVPGTALAALRREYHRGALDESDAGTDPLPFFQRWFDEAVAAREPEPSAMTLATTDERGRPSTRTVLLKGCDARGLVFFTNYESRKARHLAALPYASLHFAWPGLERQVEINGRVEPVSRAETEAYFDTRPLASRIGAWASPQSRPLAGRSELDDRVNAALARFRREPLAAPPFWGGYRVLPETFEFWQGRPSRLHDRLRYTRQPDGTWRRERLAP